jgi:hypothetical protein
MTELTQASRRARPASYLPALASLLALAAVAFLGKSYETTLRGIDSNIHAAVSMSVTSGPGLKPRLPIPIKNFSAAAAPAASGAPESPAIDPNHVFNDHPFFLFWLNGLVMRALGPSGWSARLLTGLFSVGSVCLTLAIGELLATPAFGVLAALLLIFCRDFILTSATVSLDTGLVFFIVLTFYLWLRRRWAWLGLAAGVGLWIKTPLVLLVFPVALLHEACVAPREGRRQRLIRLCGAGAAALAAGSLVWLYTGTAGSWALVRDYWVRQLWGTAVGGRGAQAQGWDWGRFFFYNLRTGFLPGLPFLVVAIIQIARKGDWRRDSVAVPGLAVAVIALVVTALRFKMGHYFTPIFPFLALLAAHSCAGWLGGSERREARFYAGLSVVTPLLLAFFLIWPVSFGPEPFVALRRFAPYIQTHGGCDDVIALVPGGEPVGSDLDASLFLTFYTGRTVESLACDRISARLESPARPAWVILSDDNLRHCLTPAARAHYPTALLVDSQVLLTAQFAVSALTDLTPLDLDLQAVTDCQAPRYPRDLWHKYLSPR